MKFNCHDVTNHGYCDLLHGKNSLFFYAIFLASLRPMVSKI